MSPFAYRSATIRGITAPVGLEDVRREGVTRKSRPLDQRDLRPLPGQQRRQR
jgi:hypothetical protein